MTLLLPLPHLVQLRLAYAKFKLNALAKREVIKSRRDDVADVKEMLP